jgi:hypothetical protein
MEWKQIVGKTAEYILSLSDRTNITMYQAIQSACPDVQLEDVPDVLSFLCLNEIVDAVEKTGIIILDYSAHEGLCEGLPFNMDFIVRRKRLRKAQIISNMLCYGPCPEPEDAIEQRLTISATGHVWFTEYAFGEIGNGKHPIRRREQFSIGKIEALSILSLIADYAESESLLIRCTDIGDWNLTVTDLEGHKNQMSGSLCGEVTVGNIDLTDYIRAAIHIEDLAVFGGGLKETVLNNEG